MYIAIPVFIFLCVGGRRLYLFMLCLLSSALLLRAPFNNGAGLRHGSVAAYKSTQESCHVIIIRKNRAKSGTGDCDVQAYLLVLHAYIKLV